jgi:DinB superfamily
MWHVPRSDPWVWPPPGTEPVPERTDESIQKFSAFANVAYHCLWFLDFYVSNDPVGFSSPEYVRGGPEELVWPADDAAPVPGHPFPREDLIRYLDHGRRQLRGRLASVSQEELTTPLPAGHPHAGKTLRQLLDVNLNHVREHGKDLADFVERGSVAP